MLPCVKLGVDVEKVTDVSLDPSGLVAEKLFEYRSILELVFGSTPLPMPTGRNNPFGVIGKRRKFVQEAPRSELPGLTHLDLTSNQGAQLSPRKYMVVNPFGVGNCMDSTILRNTTHPNSLIFSQISQFKDLYKSNNAWLVTDSMELDHAVLSMEDHDTTFSRLVTHKNQPDSYLSYVEAAQRFMPSPPTSVFQPYCFNDSVKIGAGDQMLTAPATPDSFKILQARQEPEILVPTPVNYRPTRMALQAAGLVKAFGFSQGAAMTSNYQGSGNTHRHVFHLPDNENCTLFLTNIPTTTHISEIFDKIDTGAVFCLHVNPANENFTTCAAKLSFMRPESAANFMAKINSIFGIWFRGKQLHGVYNREGDRINTARLSRVIVIEGPEVIMATSYWETYFRKICVYQLDRVLSTPCFTPGRKALQFSFARIDGQAQSCLQAIQLQDEYRGQVEVRYGVDPCETWSRVEGVAGSTF